MRTFFVLFIALMLLGVFLLAACDTQTEIENADEFEDAALGYTLYLENSATAPVSSKVREFDVRLSSDDGFFPTTYEANLGDTVKLFFALQVPHFITIEEMGVGSDVQTEVIEFVPMEQGVFEMICMNCNSPAVALIVVN